MKPEEKVIPDFLFAVIVILVFVGGGFLSGHYWWPKVETETIEKKEEGIRCISKLEDGRVLKNYSTECSEVMWIFDKAHSDYASLQSERQKLACEKANGEFLDRLGVETRIVDRIINAEAACITPEGVYEWNGDKF